MEALPRAVQQLHDAPGLSGLSPYEILYGRHRPYAGIPYDPPSKMEDAVSFFQRQAEVDAKVAKALTGFIPLAPSVSRSHPYPPNFLPHLTSLLFTLPPQVASYFVFFVMN